MLAVGNKFGVCHVNNEGRMNEERIKAERKMDEKRTKNENEWRMNRE